MSTLGFAMICHTALPRAAQVARHWAERDCPVVIHVDKSVGREAFNAFRQSLAIWTTCGSASATAANGAPGRWWRPARQRAR
jgi:hypothetical protein